MSAPVFVTAASISAELHQAMIEARGLALTAKNARALAVRAGSKTVGFRAITDFIEELASSIIQQSQTINTFAEHLSLKAVEAWRSNTVNQHFCWLITQNDQYLNSMSRQIQTSNTRNTALEQDLQIGLRKLIDQLDESRKHIRTANLIATSSHVEASSAGDFREQLEVIADNIRETANRIGGHLNRAHVLLNQSHRERKTKC